MVDICLLSVEYLVFTMTTKTQLYIFFFSVTTTGRKSTTSWSWTSTIWISLRTMLWNSSQGRKDLWWRTHTIRIGTCRLVLRLQYAALYCERLSWFMQWNSHSLNLTGRAKNKFIIDYWLEGSWLEKVVHLWDTRVGVCIWIRIWQKN